MDSYKTYSDEQLVELLKTSDERAFNEVYNRYWEKLFHKAGYKLNDLARAEEIVQDIFMDIWYRRNELSLNSSLAAYLSASLKYQIIKVHAKARSDRKHLENIKRSAADFDIATQQQLSFKELQKNLEQLVGELPEKCRLVFQLRQEGFSQKEISAQMSISENTVETHISRALKTLRTGLSHFFHLFL